MPINGPPADSQETARPVAAELGHPADGGRSSRPATLTPLANLISLKAN